MDAASLVVWGAERPQHADLVWFATLDGRYQVEVQRDRASADPLYRGRLCVFDHDQAMKPILDEPVALSYGARFGPDITDIAAWQERVLALVDAPPSS